jgi:hypothetical protein
MSVPPLSRPAFVLVFLGPSINGNALPLPQGATAFISSLGSMTWLAAHLEVVLVVCAALCLGLDMVDLITGLDPVCPLAWLAQVLVSGEDALPELIPGGAVASGVPAFA